MSIHSEISRLKQNVTDAFTAVGDKGGTLPDSRVSGNLAAAIGSIPTGADLNFDVVGNPRPDAPKENTVWLNTDIPIAEWRIANTNPYEYQQKISGFTVSEGQYINHLDRVIPVEDWKTTEPIVIPDGAESVTVPTVSTISVSVSHRFLDGNGNTVSTVERDAANPTYAIPAGAKLLQVSLYETDPEEIVFHINDAAEGKVWILSDDRNSSFAFDALKHNGIRVCPISAKQYLGGAWVDVGTKSWNGEEWVDWIIWLYNAGDECLSLTGGWSASGYSLTSESGTAMTENTGTKTTGYLEISYESGYNAYFFGTQNAINLTNVDYLEITGNRMSGEDIYICVSETKNVRQKVTEDTVVCHRCTNSAGDFTQNVPVTALDGKYYISISPHPNSNKPPQWRIYSVRCAV